METKSLFASKTFWFNALTILVTIATFFGYTPDQTLAADLTGKLLIFAPVINILLRLITTQPATLSK